MPPLEFHPLLKRARWGGRRLGNLLHKPLGPEPDYAESWELSDCGDDQTLVVAGPYEGWPLSRLVRFKGSALLGQHDGLARFPLLLKFLDATDRLSVQVHPNDRAARRFGWADNGKTEAWVILQAAPDSRLYAGLQLGVGIDSLKQHLAAGTVEQCLHAFPVLPGDCVLIPAGTVHAIGEGILLAEIQQTCDVTFRLHDWNRLGPDGRPRPLHIEDALECIDFRRGPITPATPQPAPSSGAGHRVDELCRSPYFVLRRHHADQPLEFTPRDRFHILTFLEGTATLDCGPFHSQARPGHTTLLPANARPLTITPATPITFLEAYLP